MYRGGRRHAGDKKDRITWLIYGFAFLGILLVLRLGYLQIMQYGLYAFLASDQHDLQTKLLPTRGQILVRDRADGALHPLATNQLTYQIYAVPREMDDAVTEGRSLASALGVDDVDLVSRLTARPDSAYTPVAKDASPQQADAVRALGLKGVGIVQTTSRFYPEVGVGGQLIGFVTQADNAIPKGQYGIEGSYNTTLSGTPGTLFAEKDASGRRLTIGNTQMTQATDGSDVVLTIDRSIQYKACDVIQRAVKTHGADQGSIIIIDPQTGAILAMCSAPDFDPAHYNEIKDLSVLNNPVTFDAYEPGSIFKAITMAGGLDAGKVLPGTTYLDNGFEEIDGFKIKNSDARAHGVQTMTQVLDESLNTGAIFVQRQLGKSLFQKYVEAFGFGVKTGVELSPESKGNVSSLSKKGDVYPATASFGQGITVTPLQITSAYAALANGGHLMRPYVVDEVIHPDGTTEKTKPVEVGTPISTRASRLITGMLVSVVENGHGKQAGVPGYWVAGKTGTAQVARTDGLGYQTDNTVGSFAGYAPSGDPKFVMLVKIDHPRDVQWAESSAAPVFGEMAKYLLTYLQVPPERPLKGPPPAPVLPPTPAATTTTP